MGDLKDLPNWESLALPADSLSNLPNNDVMRKFCSQSADGHIFNPLLLMDTSSTPGGKIIKFRQALCHAL